ncbi:MAG TPA: hypothetical protein VEZ90_16795 [Blastocatellia bacterium]|nr:hypothetical protein [Blastocatellia bacterium]
MLNILKLFRTRNSINNVYIRSARAVIVPTGSLALVALLFCAAAFGQAPTRRTSGIYLTAADYESGRLSFGGDCGSKTHKLEVHDVLGKPYVDVTDNSQKHRYSKGGIFGFRSCEGYEYRFAANRQYQIIESKDIYLYVRPAPATSGKGFRVEADYYFSVSADGPIQALTLENLKQAVPDNQSFHDSVDAAFGAGQNLAQYDEFRKMFKINWLLEASRGQ